jgi:hypothetical protein
VAGEASRKSVTTGCGVVKNSGFGDGFGHGRILPRRTILFHRPANFALAAATAPVLSPIPASDLKPSNGAFPGQITWFSRSRVRSVDGHFKGGRLGTCTVCA